MANIKDLTGQVFGRLTVLKSVGFTKWRNLRWLCQCSCGNQKVIQSGNLRSGHSKSCGCWNIEQQTIHGHAVCNVASPTYSSWQNMLTRCTNPQNPSYLRYGGLGVTVCERWLHSFENFLADLGERPVGTTLGRILDQGNYIKGNAFWQTMPEQKLAQRNKRALLKFAQAA